MGGPEDPRTASPEQDESVGAIAELYLGNVLYALELAAVTLEQQAQPENAAFYRAIARKLAEARGRSKMGKTQPG